MSRNFTEKLEAGSCQHRSYLLFAAFAVHVPQVAFHLQELGRLRLLRGRRRRVARSWREIWRSLRGRRRRISRRRRRVGNTISSDLVPVGRVGADVWVQHVHVGLNV